MKLNPAETPTMSHPEAHSDRGTPNRFAGRTARRLLLRGVEHRVQVSMVPVNELEKELDVFLARELEINTWASYRRAISEVRMFANYHGLEMCEHVVCLWLLSILKDPHRHLTFRGTLQYAKEASAALTRLGIPRYGELSSMTSVLRKLGGNLPEGQAKPAEIAKVYAFVDNTQRMEDERMLIYLGWKAAARADDLQKLDPRQCRRITHHGRDLIVLTWRPTAQVNPFASGRMKSAQGRIKTCVLDCQERTPTLWTWLQRRTTVTTLNTAAIDRIVRKMDPAYSGHSLKRGALHHVLEKGANLDQIVRLARHANSHDPLPAQTRVYLPHVLLALAEGTQEATRLL